jgi:hypothetical protein
MYSVANLAVWLKKTRDLFEAKGNGKPKEGKKENACCSSSRLDSEPDMRLGWGNWWCQSLIMLLIAEEEVVVYKLIV